MAVVFCGCARRRRGDGVAPAGQGLRRLGLGRPLCQGAGRPAAADDGHAAAVARAARAVLQGELRDHGRRRGVELVNLLENCKKEEWTDDATLEA